MAVLLHTCCTALSLIGITFYSRRLSKCGGNSAVECQLPKLDVAGSIPVPRSILSISCRNRFHPVLRLCSVYITCRLFSSLLTAGSLLSTDDCV